MSRNLNAPFFPVPPDQYSRAYMSSLVQSFSTFINQVGNPGEGRNTFTVFTNVPTTATGNESGTVYNDNTILRLASATAASNTVGVPLPSYAVATLPAVETGTLIYVTNGAAGSPVVAFGDGSNWLRVDTRAAVST